MRIVIQLVIFFFIAFPLTTYAKDEIDSHRLFDKLFADWTAAFNRKDISKTCHLFSKSVIANYQGVPPKDYAAICDGFKKIFTKSNLRYQYSFKLHQVYRSEALAVVRITWYLRIYEKGKLKSITQDEGIDIFQKNNQGQWQIVNYLSYGKEIPIGRH
jgi:ketosteroid isomerase-like protein